MKTQQGLQKIPISDPEMYFSWLMVVLWTQYTIFPFIIRIIWHVPVIGDFREYLIPVIVIALLIFSFPALLYRIRATDILFYLVSAVLVIGTMIFLPENGVYIEERFVKILITGIPMFFVGICYRHERMKYALYYASLINLIVRLSYQILQIASGAILLSDNMDMSYKMLPSIMFLLYWMFENFRPKDILVGIVAIVLSFSYGTRGPILIVLLYLAMGIYTKVIRSKSMWIRVSFVFISIFLFIVLFNIHWLYDIAQRISALFESVGFSSRIFDMFISGNLSDGAGRDQLYSFIIEAIKEKPLTGYGLMGDRVLLGRYVHNILLEFWCDYGVIIGTVLLGALIILYLKALYRCRNKNQFFFISSMIFMVFIRLLLSGSYVYDKNFYWVIGLCVGFLRNRYENDMNDPGTNM